MLDNLGKQGSALGKQNLRGEGGIQIFFEPCAHGRGYSTAQSTGLTETLKSLQTRTDPFFFTTGTIGVVHSLYSSLDRMPSFSRCVNSASTLGRSAYGTWRNL